MKCKTVNKQLILFYNNELSEIQNQEIKDHLENCKVCYSLYYELEMTFNLIVKKEILKPNPYLYTIVNQRLIDIKNKKTKSIFRRVNKKVLQHALLSLMLVMGLWGGIKLGNINEVKQKERLIVSKTTEFYFNDLKQESVELVLLNK